MKRKKMFGYISTVFIVFLMVSSATAVNLIEDNNALDTADEKDSNIVKNVEKDNNQEIKPAGFVFNILWVYVYMQNIFKGPLPMGLYPVEVRDGDVTVRTGKTGFLGNKLFFCLKKDHTYQIRIKNNYGGYEVKEIKINRFFQYIELCVNPLGDPPLSPKIEGPTSGIAGITYNYIIHAFDPEEDNVRYHIDWGDGQNLTTKFYSCYAYITVNHSWIEEGNYTITVYAEDEHGLFGPENTLEVTMS